MDANRISTGYELKDELARLCLPPADGDRNQRLAWTNSICILFFTIRNARETVRRSHHRSAGHVSAIRVAGWAANNSAIYCSTSGQKCLTTPGTKCNTSYMLFSILRSAPRSTGAAATGLFLLVVDTTSLPAEGLQPPGSPAPSINAVTNAAAPVNSSNPPPAGSNTPPPTVAVGSATNLPTQLGNITVTADLDAAREQIAPSLGAVTYKIGANQIQSISQGENSPFQQVLLHAPGVVQEEFGEIHVRGDHGDVQYRINDVSLPESLNGFGQEIDPHLINSVTLITGTLPAQFGDRTAGIIDVTTKTGSQLNGDEVSLYGGSYDTIHPSGSFGGTTSNLDYFVTGSYLHDNLGIDNTTASANPLHDITDQEKFFGYFSHHFDKTSRLTLLLSGSYADFEIPNTPGLSPNYMN